jgi:hypothetical protein
MHKKTSETRAQIWGRGSQNEHRPVCRVYPHDFECQSTSTTTPDKFWETKFTRPRWLVCHVHCFSQILCTVDFAESGEHPGICPNEEHGCTVNTVLRYERLVDLTRAKYVHGVITKVCKRSQHHHWCYVNLRLIIFRGNNHGWISKFGSGLDPEIQQPIPWSRISQIILSWPSNLRLSWSLTWAIKVPKLYHSADWLGQ